MPDSRPTIVIVDDESAIRTTLTVVFTELEYSVRSASDGFSALALIQEAAPDVLLSDLNMPGMSGFELLSVVRRGHPGIHVVATSGAFSGKSVPTGVVADAIYEKATGLGVLVEVVQQGRRWEGAIQRSSVGHTPIWISPTGQLPSNDFYVLMSCPSCLRACPKLLDEEEQLVCQTGCLHCGATISYAMAPIVASSNDGHSPPCYSHWKIGIDNIALSAHCPSVSIQVPATT